MQITICLLVFLFMVISFSMNKIPMALTSMIGMLVLVISGCVDSKTALGNIGSNTVITMIAMFVIAAGLNRTQMVHHLSKMVYKVTKGSFTKVLAGYVLVTFALGQFIPSITALFALVCPLVVSMCEEMDISPSKMMYSIGLVAVAGSFTITPIGPYAASFIEDNGYLTEYGITDYAFTMFTEMSIKVPVVLFVLVWAIFFAPKFAPDKPVVPIKTTEGRKRAQREPLGPVQEVLGYAVFAMLAAEEAEESAFAEYLAFCRGAGIPISLEALGLQGRSRAEWESAYDNTVGRSGSIHSMPFAADKNSLIQSVLDADAKIRRMQ